MKSYQEGITKSQVEDMVKQVLIKGIPTLNKDNLKVTIKFKPVNADTDEYQDFETVSVYWSD